MNEKQESVPKLDLGKFRAALERENADYEKGVGLSLEGYVARNAIKIERRYFYGQPNNRSRLDEMRILIENNFVKIKNNDN